MAAIKTLAVSSNHLVIVHNIMCNLRAGYFSAEVGMVRFHVTGGTPLAGPALRSVCDYFVQYPGATNSQLGLQTFIIVGNFTLNDAEPTASYHLLSSRRTPSNDF